MNRIAELLDIFADRRYNIRRRRRVRAVVIAFERGHIDAARALELVAAQLAAG